MNLLLCTLGASWAVIPEVFGWLGPEQLDLYAAHPDRDTLFAPVREHDLRPPDELWVCTSEGEQTLDSLDKLCAWWRALGEPLPLRIWTAAGTDQLAAQGECDHIRELTLRVALAATERCGPDGQLVLSLAGGRKTMSADLQWAGNLFGARAWLHVVGPNQFPPPLDGKNPVSLAHPLPAALADKVIPLVVGQGQRSDFLDVDLNGKTVTAASYPVPLPAGHCSWSLPPEGAVLTREVLLRERQSAQLLGNFMARLADEEHHENWRSLYRLPPRQIQALRHTPVTPRHHTLLLELPKADLHRHLGGSLDLASQREVAAAILSALDTHTLRAAREAVRPLLDSPAEWPWGWPTSLAADGLLSRAARSAVLLAEAPAALIEHNLYAVTEPRVALKTRHQHGFAAYERPGELSGSAMLGHAAALPAYARALVQQARAEGLSYLELRGSPQKYRSDDPARFVLDLQAALAAAGANGRDENSPRIGFIWILDRRHPNRMPEHIEAAVRARQQAPDFLLGLDLAGDEGTHRPDSLASHFIPAFRDCIPLTIHAGEGESADNIWQATYRLHADRIGHGLTLADNPALADRFRDRGILLELCPTSNREVVGFSDAYVADQGPALPRYPLRTFIAAGLPVTLCTDNPGISRTTLADEYLAAVRMTEGGLSVWEALSLMRQAFIHAFLPAHEREKLLKHADRKIFEMFSGQFGPASL